MFWLFFTHFDAFKMNDMHNRETEMFTFYSLAIAYKVRILWLLIYLSACFIFQLLALWMLKIFQWKEDFGWKSQMKERV